MGIDVTQLRELVVVPALNCIGLWSEAAENLVVGTALVESRGEYLKQLGSGPALGLWQMEPDTHDDIWENYLEYKEDLSEKVHSLASILAADGAVLPPAGELIGNLPYAAAMCRVHYRRVPEALPHASDARAMAAYWKTHYNTHLGSGTVEKALPYFEEVCDGE